MLYIIFLLQVLFVNILFNGFSSDGAVFIALFSLLLLFVLSKSERIEKRLVFVVLVVTCAMFYINLPCDLSVLDGRKIELTGRVINFVDSPRGYKRSEIETQSINSEKIKARVELYVDTPLHEGDVIKLVGRTKIPKSSGNPGGFDYRKYFVYSGLSATVYADEITVLKKSDNLALSNGVERLEALLSKHLSDDNVSVLSSVLFGESRLMSREVADKYKTLNLLHILSVSGLHISLIVTTLFYFLNALGASKKKSYYISLAIAILYGALIGFRPSIVRGLIMSFCIFLPMVIMRPVNKRNLIAATAILMMCINPLWSFGNGFWLSLFATFALIVFSRIIARLSIIKELHLSSKIISVISVTVFCAPLMLLYYKEVYLIGLFANILLLPILTAIISLGAAMFFISFISLKAALFIAYIISVLFFPVNIISDFLYDVFPFAVRVAGFNILYAVLCYLMFDLIFTFCAYELKSGRRIKAIYLTVCICIFSFLSLVRGGTHVYFVDVGQGDCALIYDGITCAMIDTGGSTYANRRVGERYTLPALDELGIDRIDYLFLSHFDSDHIEACDYIVDKKSVGTVFVPYEADNYILKKLKMRGAEVIEVSSGDFMVTPLGEFRFFSPTRIFDDENNNSCVFVYSKDGKRFLFTGDAPSKIEDEISGDIGDVDVLKVSHHGSKYSTSANFLRNITPEYGIISVGADNSYGHPAQDVLKALRGAGVKIFRTDKDGMICMNTSGEFKIRTFKGSKNDFLTGMSVNLIFIFLFIIAVEKMRRDVDGLFEMDGEFKYGAVGDVIVYRLGKIVD